MGADFSGATSHGFTKEQLYSTASYRNKNLFLLRLDRNNLSGWDFSNQNLQAASFEFSNLQGASLTGENLSGSSFKAPHSPR